MTVQVLQEIQKTEKVEVDEVVAVVVEEEEKDWWLIRMAQQLSGVTVVIIIAGGVLTFLLLFIFAKRQIMRFTLRTRGPNVPFGTDASKSLRREIHRRIDAIHKITYEPKVLLNEEENKKLCHFYRMKAVDDAKVLEESMINKKLGKKQSFESLRSYLIVTLSPQLDPKVIQRFADLYEAARYNPKPFNESEYRAFQKLLKQLEEGAKTAQPRSFNQKSPPTKHGLNVTMTPKQQTKVKLSPTPEVKSFNKSDLPLNRRLTNKSHSSSKYSQETDEKELCDSSTTSSTPFLPGMLSKKDMVESTQV